MRILFLTCYRAHTSKFKSLEQYFHLEEFEGGQISIKEEENFLRKVPGGIHIKFHNDPSIFEK